eukprot:jgi/Astpho2/6945/Aster-x0745
MQGSQVALWCAGVLLGTQQTQATKTLTHTLWALYNVLPAYSVQAPHRHAATALDLAAYAPEGTYTMMAINLDDQGQLVDPIKRILNIRFAPEEAAALRQHIERGATIAGQNVKI